MNLSHGFFIQQLCLIYMIAAELRKYNYIWALYLYPNAILTPRNRTRVNNEYNIKSVNNWSY